MGSAEFIELAKGFIAKQEKVSLDQIYVVWLTKVLQNNKALLSTTRVDGKYFEVTYNGDKAEMYVDTYVRESNVPYSVEAEA